MRAKTSRLYKKAMHSYGIGFGFRAPYQILLDSSFIKLATEQRLSLQEDLQMLLSSPTRPLVTACVVNEIHKQGDHRAASVAKTFESRKCKHHHPVSSAQCLMDLLGSDNANNYCIATQNNVIRKHIRDMPGVPVLKVQKGMIILESLSTATKDAIQKIAKMIQPPPSSNATTAAAAAAAATGPAHKKRKVKGVNPLSMKKKK
ncbi:Fcf1-domain-containing protein, partial [Absidia repens]